MRGVDRSRIGPSAATTHRRAPTMPNGMRWVGLDVHARVSTVAVFDDVTGEVITRRVNGRPLEVLDVLHRLPRPLRAVYEAGPTGYGLVRRARLRLAAFLLRRERYFPGPGERWTLKHRHWLSQQGFDDAPSRVTYADYLHAHDVLLARRELVARELEQIAPTCVWGQTIARLCCLRGINTLTALGLCAEIGDWNRFDHPDSIAKYVGLVPSEHSSGQTRRLGKITKAGSTHARRLLVEAALHYRLTPAVGGKLAIRQRGQDPALIDHAWRVQRRLNARWNLLRNGRGKPAGIVTIAIARELVGACWEIATAR